MVSETVADGRLTGSGGTSSFRGNVTIVSGSLILSGGTSIGSGNMIINGGRPDLGSTDYVPPATLLFQSGDIAASSTGYIDLNTLTTTLTTDIGSLQQGFISATLQGPAGLTVESGTKTDQSLFANAPLPIRLQILS